MGVRVSTTWRWQLSSTSALLVLTAIASVMPQHGNAQPSAAVRMAQAEMIPLPEHPRPDFQRVDWMNLNGRWQF